MKQLAQQLASVIGAGFAGACCLGASWALATLSAVGAGFLINDAILIPLFLGLVLLSVALVYRSARAQGARAPLVLAATGAVVAIAGLFVSSILIYSGLGAIVAASLWARALGARAKA